MLRKDMTGEDEYTKISTGAGKIALNPIRVINPSNVVASPAIPNSTMLRFDKTINPNYYMPKIAKLELTVREQYPMECSRKKIPVATVYPYGPAKLHN